jgi:radical SAM protein with 4Fe4S-binding SPASM domain
MEIDIWQFAHLSPRSEVFHVVAIACQEGRYRDSLPVCSGNRGMVAVSANGNMYPCLQMSGYYNQHQWFLGNVKEDGLQKHLQEGTYLDEVCTTVKDLSDHNEKCRSCQWFRYCCGGCRAVGLAITGDKMGADPTRCLFYTGGYLEKLQRILSDCPNGRQYRLYGTEDTDQ